MKRRKNRKKVFFFKAVLVLFMIILLLLFVYILYLYFKKPVIISPLGEKTISKIQTITDSLIKNHIPYTSIETASDSSYLVNLSDGGQVIISGAKDIGIQISSLQLILKRLTIEGKRIKKVDFRFEKPLLSF